MLVATLATIACQSSDPIQRPRESAPEPDASQDFRTGQRERLAALRAAVAEPVSAELAGGVVVRLAFEKAADFDLFVTDPSQESVYFANTPSRSGGKLLADRRCEDAAPRVETVHFPNPGSGRYRVGVDFHRRCSGGSRGDGLYHVRVDEGGRVLERDGKLKPGLFEVIVIEFDVGAPTPVD